MTQASRFIVWLAGGGRRRCSTQVRKGKYWPDGTFASSFIFHFAYGGFLPGAGKVFGGEAEPEMSRMLKSLRCASGPGTSASALNYVSATPWPSYFVGKAVGEELAPH